MWVNASISEKKTNHSLWAIGTTTKFQVFARNSEEWQQLQAKCCLRLPLLLPFQYRTTTCDISKLQYRTMCNINVLPSLSPAAAYLLFLWEQLHFQYHLRTTANSFHQEVTAFSGNCLSRSWYETRKLLI